MPFAITLTLIAITLSLLTPLLLSKLLPNSSSIFSPPKVVSFDIIKFLNSQRAIASQFMTPNSPGATESAEIFASLSDRTRSTIAAVAGPDTLVIIKQAVVQGQTLDITDQVLERLNLPIAVPTQDPGVLLDPTPTQPQLLYKITPQKPRPPANPPSNPALP